MKSTSLLAAAIIIFLSLGSPCYSQVQTPRQISVSGSCGGFYEYLPQGYNSNTTKTYPLIVAVHGIGELGNGTTDLPNILNCWTALPRLIENGGFPSSFSVAGQSFSFIVISPQFKWWPYASDVNDVVDYAIKNYRVDQSRIYVTGLSMGGGSVWDFAGNFPTKAAAIVPICGAASSDVTRAQAIANAKLPVWATHNQDDPTVSSSNTAGWVNLINQYGGNIQSTIFPVSGHDAWTKTYDPGFTQNGVNIYQWMLMHQKGNSTPVTNQNPVSNAGANQIISLPQNSVTLNGVGSDVDGTISSYEWSQLSGPSQANIASAYTASTAVNNLSEGSYVFTLKVTDDKGASATSNVTIKVNAQPSVVNQPPTGNAGTNQAITLPVNTVTLSGSGSDADGTISFYEWKQSSGPSQANIVSPYSASTAVNNLSQGEYIFTLKVTDNQGATATSNVTIQVNAAVVVVNQPPVANAGADQTITLPQNSITLNGSGTDVDGTVVSYQWSQISGPSQVTIALPLSASTVVNNLVQGTYSFKLTVEDNSGAKTSDEIIITVNEAPNKPPVSKAGADQTITLPLSSVVLRGAGSDPDGTISSYQWSQVSGPSKSMINSLTSATTLVDSLKQGIYVFRLTVTDNKGLAASDEVTITVNRAPNQPPVVNAGPDQTITLPTDSVDLFGAVSDSDGTISSYQWTQISGPTKTSFSTASPLALTVHNLVEGVYNFRLTAFDNDGAITWNDVRVTVLPDPRRQSTAMVYPNPATNMIYLRIDAVTLQSNTLIRIINSSGDVVYTESFLRTDFRVLRQIDISKLPRGAYFVTVTADINTNTTLTLIKQ
jgi:dienelactone hydrolase